MNDLAAVIRRRYPGLGSTGVKGASVHTKWLSTVPLRKLRQDARITMDRLFAQDAVVAKFVKEHTKEADVVVHYRCACTRVVTPLFSCSTIAAELHWHS
jgi:hypothetical protein